MFNQTPATSLCAVHFPTTSAQATEAEVQQALATLEESRGVPADVWEEAAAEGLLDAGVLSAMA